MPYSLTFSSGSLKGTSYGVPTAGLRIGRAASNDIAIPDPALSRAPHCVLELRGEELWLRDAGGRNGTYVNGARIDEARIRAGDRVKIGESVFVVDDGESRSSSAQSDFEQALTKELDPAASRYFAAETSDDGSAVARGPVPSASSALLPSARTTRDLRGLLSLAGRLHTIRDRATLEQVLVDGVATLFQAELVALVKMASDEAELVVVMPPPAGGGTTVSRTVVQRVRATRRAVLLNDVGTSEFQAARSVVLGSVRSVLCAPVIVADDVSAALYVASQQAGYFFGNDDLELVTAVANLAALSLENMGHIEWLSTELARTRPQLAVSHGLIGHSPAVQHVLGFVAKASRVDATVLVLGETGTGKELVARAIHHSSARSQRPLVTVNCAALPDSLVETELFGAEAGAFTDARVSRTGSFEQAHRGTLFLDEVGDLSLMAQAKLLRAIQEREVKHVGGQRTIRVDVRIIAATNRDLAKAVREGEFRDDLYHRLNVISVVIPPLRDRLDDVPRLADHFLHKFASTADRPIRGFSAQARAALLGYKWPGNVRELQHAIERAVVFGDADTILVEDLPPSVQRVPGPDRGTGGQLHHAILDVKRRLVLEALQASSSYSEAAALLGVHPNHLHRLVRNLGLKDEVAAQKGIRSDLRSSGGPENPASTRPR